MSPDSVQLPNHEKWLTRRLTSDFFLFFFFFQRRVGASLFTDVSHSAAFTWVPCSLTHSERQIPAMACRAQQAQPETRPETARCCQKELLLNVRGFASTQKRDFDAFVQWISLPAHQILAVNSPPTPHTRTAMQWRSALRPAETRVQLSHGCQAEIKLRTTELTVTPVTWQTVLDTEGYGEENTQWIRDDSRYLHYK